MYAIQRDEALPAAIVRIMDEQIVRARDTLANPVEPASERVHDARKRIKEIRAVLHLVRKPLGGQFPLENAWYRDLGRQLSAARDAEAVLEALVKLPLPVAVERRTRLALARQGPDPSPLEPRMAHVIDGLLLAHGRLALWPELEDSFDTIAGGLRSTYRQGRRLAQHHPTDEALHEWRKRVKEHWYHAQLLRAVWPEVLRPHAEVLSSLSRALGDHHDLHLLREMAAATRRPALRAAIDARQAELVAVAESLGRRVYAEKSSAWLARMRKYWTSWTIERSMPPPTDA